MTELNFGKVSDYSDQLKLIKEWALKLRRLRSPLKTTWKEPADWVVKYANIHRKPVRSLTITLTPTGCEWASRGGCTMCGEFEGSTKSKMVPSEFHVAQFASAISNYATKFNPSWIRIYQEGNYTNETEIEQSAQVTIIRLASLIRGVRRITIESMAKYLTRETISILSDAISHNVELEIGMGFEGENDVVRNVCVNKGESINDYKRATGLLKEYGVRSLAYVLLKPPFLTENEAIQEANATINYANDLGFDAISLEPVSLHRYSLVHALSLAGYYKLPWLWSIIKVVQSGIKTKDFRIGGFGFYPRPIDIAFNRHTDGTNGCNEIMWKVLRKYGKTRDFNLFKNLDCTCKEGWENECSIVGDSLKKRRMMKSAGKSTLLIQDIWAPKTLFMSAPLKASDVRRQLPCPVGDNYLDRLTDM